MKYLEAFARFDDDTGRVFKTVHNDQPGRALLEHEAKRMLLRPNVVEVEVTPTNRYAQGSKLD